MAADGITDELGAVILVTLDPGGWRQVHNLIGLAGLIKSKAASGQAPAASAGQAADVILKAANEAMDPHTGHAPPAGWDHAQGPMKKLRSQVGAMLTNGRELIHPNHQEVGRLYVAVNRARRI